MLVRANSGGWAYGEKLSAAQMNIVDSQLPYAVDGHGGGTYDPTDWIYFTGTNSKGVVYTLGSKCVIATGGHLRVESGGTVTGVSGSIWTGAFAFQSAAITLDAASTVTSASGTVWTVTFASGSTVTAAAGSTVNLNGAVGIGAAAVITAATGAKLVGGIIVDNGGFVLVNGSSITGAAGCTFGWAGTADFSDAVGMHDAVTWYSGSSWILAAGATAACATPIAMAGDGRVNPSSATITGTISYEGAAETMPSRVVLAPTADMALTLPSSGASDGQEVLLSIIGASSSYTASLYIGAVPFSSMKYASGQNTVFLLKWIGGTWKILVQNALP